MPSLDTSTTSCLSQSLIETPQKRISEVFDASLTPGGALVSIKNKTKFLFIKFMLFEI
jgi:hypothetical protein